MKREAGRATLPLSLIDDALVGETLLPLSSKGGEGDRVRTTVV